MAGADSGIANKISRRNITVVKYGSLTDSLFYFLTTPIEGEYDESTYDGCAVREPRVVVFSATFHGSFVVCGRCMSVDNCGGKVISLSAGSVSVFDLIRDRVRTVFDHAIALGQMDMCAACTLADRIGVLDGWIYNLREESRR